MVRGTHRRTPFHPRPQCFTGLVVGLAPGVQQLDFLGTQAADGVQDDDVSAGHDAAYVTSNSLANFGHLRLPLET